MHSNRYTLFFAMAVTVIASILLASAATLLKPLQTRNEELDEKKNILVAAGLLEGEALAAATGHDIEKLYDDNILEFVISAETGETVEDKTVGSLDPKVDTDLLPLYVNNKDNTMNGVIIPVSGKGLWSTIYGYIALGPDFDSVAGITFYKHGETPGLGGEIEKTDFTGDFKNNKKIFQDGKLVSITVAKGKPLEKDDHTVDGISGATLTGKGINVFLKRDLEKYLPYLNKQREVE